MLVRPALKTMLLGNEVSRGLHHAIALFGGRLRCRLVRGGCGLGFAGCSLLCGSCSVRSRSGHSFHCGSVGLFCSCSCSRDRGLFFCSLFCGRACCGFSDLLRAGNCTASLGPGAGNFPGGWFCLLLYHHVTPSNVNIRNAGTLMQVMILMQTVPVNKLQLIFDASIVTDYVNSTILRVGRFSIKPERFQPCRRCKPGNS
jgi:hypothetical protein